MKIWFKINEVDQLKATMEGVFASIGKDDLTIEMITQIIRMDRGETLNMFPFIVSRINDQYICEVNNDFVVNSLKIVNHHIRALTGIIKAAIHIYESVCDLLGQMVGELEYLFDTSTNDSMTEKEK